MDKKAEKWLQDRKIEPEIASRFGIESFIRNAKTWIKIPFIKNGEVVNHKFRCIDEKAFYQEPDGQKCFWNQDVIFDQTLKGHPLIITEGEMDALSAIQAGYPKTVSVPDGAPQKIIDGDTAKYDYLVGTINAMRETSPFVIVATDGDQAGANLFHDLSLRIGRDICKWVRFPQGCKDFNDALIKYGERAIVETINRAQWVKMDGVYTLNDLPPIPERPVFDPGIRALGEHMRIRLGDFTVVTGIPGHGKSTFVNDLCCHLANDHGLRTCFASFEQHPSLDHVRNLRRWKIGKRNGWTAAQKDQADAWVQKYFSFIYPTDMQHEEEDISMPWLMEKAAGAVTRHGANIVVVDPWNEMDHVRPRDMAMTDYVSMSIKRFKQFARQYNVHLIIVAHPTKLKKGQDGKFPMPTLYDVSDSAAWANKADLGVIVHKDGFDTTISVQKSRYHEIIGVPGNKHYRFNPEINKFEFAEF